MSAKRFVLSKSRDGLDKNKLEIGRNVITLKNLTMPTIVKGNPWVFENAGCCKISKKLKGGRFGDIKKFSKKGSHCRKQKRRKSHSAKKLERRVPYALQCF